jgi:hypothetical protein
LAQKKPELRLAISRYIDVDGWGNPGARSVIGYLECAVIQRWKAIPSRPGHIRRPGWESRRLVIYRISRSEVKNRLGDRPDMTLQFG